MMESAEARAPEFSRVVIADKVQHRELVEEIAPTEAERRALAERFELEAIGALTARVRLRRVHGGKMIRVDGHLEADVVQTCVVTLESVPAHVSEDFGAIFAPPELVPDDDEVEFDMVSIEEDQPEPMVNGRIDIGELTAQHLSLALDPYPRAPGVAYDPVAEHEEGVDAAEPGDGGDGGDRRPNPFAALAKLKTSGRT